jgi:hypothetical protein
MTEHTNTCDLVGFQQGYNAPAVCSCGFEKQKVGVEAVPHARPQLDLLNSLHAILERYGIASRSLRDGLDMLPTELVTWAADACRQSQSQSADIATLTRERAALQAERDTVLRLQREEIQRLEVELADVKLSAMRDLTYEQHQREVAEASLAQTEQARDEALATSEARRLLACRLIGEKHGTFKRAEPEERAK